jgi:hypothetical protein
VKEVLLIYLVCYADNYQGLRFLPAREAADSGGVKIFEANLREAAAWYYPIGTIESPPDEHGGLSVAMAPINALVKAWEERGSPKIQGAGTGPSPFRLRKLHNPLPEAYDSVSKNKGGGEVQ